MDDRNGVGQRAPSRLVSVRLLLRREIAPCYHTHYTKPFLGALRQSMGEILTRDGHTPLPMGSGVTVMFHVYSCKASIGHTIKPIYVHM